MPRDERRRQKALARKAGRRKEKKAAIQHAASAVRPSFRMAAQWPLYECQVSRSWQEPGELVQILVARSAGDEIAAAGFLVDLGCLGVKDALTHILIPSEYAEFRRTFTGIQPMTRADLNLAAKIIQEGIAYADRLGFKPHPDYRNAALLLADADPAACRTPIPLGMEGKPFYIPGPHDNPSRVVRQLERAVGPGNFHYVLELDDLADLPEEDVWELEPQELEPQQLEPQDRSRSVFPRLLGRFRRG
jgi:hypothetical protein